MIPPANGILLIAEPFLKDPNFIRSVTLLCKYDTTDGAVGFVINKPHQQKLGEFLPEMAAFDLPIFIGGPVQTDTLHFLHKYPEHFPEAPEISEGIYWGGDFELTKSLINDGSIKKDNIRFFLGYTGWEASQLESEMQLNSWIITENLYKNKILGKATADFWKEKILELGGEYIIWSNAPENPLLN